MNLINNVDRKQTKPPMQQYVTNAGEKAEDGVAHKHGGIN